MGHDRAFQAQFLADCTNDHAYATLLCPSICLSSVAVCCRLSVTLSIVAKRCVL